MEDGRIIPYCFVKARIIQKYANDSTKPTTRTNVLEIISTYPLPASVTNSQQHNGIRIQLRSLSITIIDPVTLQALRSTVSMYSQTQDGDETQEDSKKENRGPDIIEFRLVDAKGLIKALLLNVVAGRVAGHIVVVVEGTEEDMTADRAVAAACHYSVALPDNTNLRHRRAGVARKT
jgi:hypothetical protein